MAGAEGVLDLAPGSCSDQGPQVARVSLSLPPSIYLFPFPSICFPLKGRQSVVSFFLLVQYSFSSVSELSFKKPLELECVVGWGVRLKVVKLATDKVCSTPS